MALIKLKKATTSGYVPGVSDLEQGELGMNVPDGLLFFKKVGGSEQVMVVHPYAGTFASLTGDVGTHQINTGVTVDGNYTISLERVQNVLEIMNLETTLKSGFKAKIIITQNNSAYRMLTPDDFLIETNSKSLQTYGYNRFNITEITTGPPTHATFRTTSAHNLSVGDNVNIDNFNGDKAAYNGIHQVNEVVDTVTFNINTDYEASGGIATQPTVEKFMMCLNVNGVSMFEMNFDGTSMFLHKIGDFE